MRCGAPSRRMIPVADTTDQWRRARPRPGQDAPPQRRRASWPAPAPPRGTGRPEVVTHLGKRGRKRSPVQSGAKNAANTRSGLTVTLGTPAIAARTAPPDDERTGCGMVRRRAVAASAEAAASRPRTNSGAGARKRAVVVGCLATSWPVTRCALACVCTGVDDPTADHECRSDRLRRWDGRPVRGETNGIRVRRRACLARAGAVRLVDMPDMLPVVRRRTETLANRVTVSDTGHQLTKGDPCPTRPQSILVLHPSSKGNASTRLGADGFTRR